MSELLWQPSPSRIAAANLPRFMDEARRRWHVSLDNYGELYRWSIGAPEQFWDAMWSFGGMVSQMRGSTVLEHPAEMPGARWFPEARLNFAENLLRRRDDTEALVFRGEDRVQRTLTHSQLYTDTARLSHAFRDAGITAGDRVAGYMPNMPETVAAMLAAASIGAIWSSCSPDFGIDGVVDRFGQIAPKLLMSADGYFYHGKWNDSLRKLEEVRRRIPSIEHIVVVPYSGEEPRTNAPPGTTWLNRFTSGRAGDGILFEQLPFAHPLYVMYSSGTTGVPKCIVHGAGGTLIQHLKEHLLHVDIHPGDRLFYFTTCGWMMWNWLVSGLASGATLLLYDGSPFYPDGNALFDFADAAAMTVFGTSAKYIDALKKTGLTPGESHDLGALKTILSTGSPLAPESFDFVYSRIKRDVCLSSISGGTDIISCFVLGNPLLPVRRGEIQCRGLGMGVEVFDEGGRSVRGRQGELVCTAPFPSMPVGFWNDPGDVKYRAAYFERYPGTWCHGDYVALTEHDGMIVYGRSDAVLNSGGVRIGTAEIYRQVEQLEEVVESLAIGQEWEHDTRIVLFVRLRDGLSLDDGLARRIKERIRKHATPRHVPAKIVQVADIPRTRSGKIVELAVREIVHGRPVKNLDALANPQALDAFRDIPQLGT